MMKMDNGQILIRKAHLSLQHRWAKKDIYTLLAGKQTEAPPPNITDLKYSLI